MSIPTAGEVGAFILGWALFILAVAALIYLGCVVRDWLDRRALRRRCKDAALGTVVPIRSRAERLRTSTTGAANREGTERSTSSSSVALDRPAASLSSPTTPGARSSRGSGGEKPFMEDRRLPR